MEEETAATEADPPNNGVPKPESEKNATENSTQERSVAIGDVSSHVTCGLCRGYLIDAQTVTDCVHSFCRSCLLKYLRTNDSCPRCRNKIYNTPPLLNVRSDRKLQDLVYKLVPNLFRDEMLKRREFFRACPPQGFDFSEDQKTSVCLRLCDRYPPYDHIKEKDICIDKRFLLCPGHFTVKLLEKFVRLKFNLSTLYKVSLFCDSESLYPEYTLIDIMLVHSRLQTEPLLINYVVQDQSYTFLRQLKMVEDRRIVSKEADSEVTQFPFNSMGHHHGSSNNETRDKQHSHVGCGGRGVSPNGVSIHIKHKDGTYHVTSPKDTEHGEQAMYRLPPQKKKRGRPPKRPPTGVVATQRVKKSKKDSLMSGGVKHVHRDQTRVDKEGHSQFMSAPPQVSCPAPVVKENPNCFDVQDNSANSLCPSFPGQSSIIIEDVSEETPEVAPALQEACHTSTTDVLTTASLSSAADAGASSSTAEAPQPVNGGPPQTIPETVNLPVTTSQPVLQYSHQPVPRHPVSQSQQGVNRAAVNHPQQLTGSPLTVVNSSYQVLTQVPNMVSSNGVLGAGGLIPANNQPSYTVSCMPMAMPKIKRKRGRPPKNRSLMGFPGRCSPMPRHFGIPGGSPMYALVKKKRGRPPKRKVGLPPVLVVPQPSPHSGVQIGRNVQLTSGGGGVHIANTPVYVDSNTGVRYIQSNSGVAYVNAGNNVQYSGGGALLNQLQNSHSSFQQPQQTHQPLVVRNNNNIIMKQETNSVAKRADIPVVVNTAPAQESHGSTTEDTSRPNSANVPDGLHIINITPVDTKLEQEGDDTSLISQEVVGDIINKLEDRSNSATPLSSVSNCTGPTLDNTTVNYCFSQAPQLTTVVESGQTTSTHTVVAPSKSNVSPYERQFENFLQRTKADVTCGLKIILSDSSASVGKTTNVEEPIVSSLTATPSNKLLPLLSSQTDSEADKVMEESSSVHHQHDNVNLANTSCSSLPLPASESVDHKLIDNSSTSNPTSPYSDSSHKDGTPNSKRSSLSSSDLKEQKRHNLNKLTEKLHSIGEKKRPSTTPGTSETASLPPSSNGNIIRGVAAEEDGHRLPSESQLRKSVISALGNNKHSIDGVSVETIKKTCEQKLCTNTRQPNTATHPRHNVMLHSSMSQTLQGTVPRVAHSVMSLPSTSLQGAPGSHGGYTKLVSNGYLHPLTSGMTTAYSNNQTVLSVHSNSPASSQAKIIDTKTGLVYHANGAVFPPPQNLGIFQNGGNQPTMKMPPGKNNAVSKRMAAQKKKQAALQRLNGKTKSGVQPPQGPFYVGLNFFNCPYGPQQGNNNTVYGPGNQTQEKAYMYSSSTNGEVKGAIDNKKLYSSYTATNGMTEPDTSAVPSDTPLDFSLKKSK